MLVLLSTQLRSAELSGPPSAGTPTRNPFLQAAVTSAAAAVAVPPASSPSESAHALVRCPDGHRGRRVITALLSIVMRGIEAPSATAAVLTQFNQAQLQAKQATTAAAAPPAASGAFVLRLSCRFVLVFLCLLPLLLWKAYSPSCQPLQVSDPTYR